MDKLEIKVTIDQLKVINLLFNNKSSFSGTSNKELKVLLSISNLLYKRLKKIEINKETSSKPFTIKFHYFEAYFLQKIINNRDYLLAEHIEYYENVLSIINFELDKQLV